MGGLCRRDRAKELMGDEFLVKEFALLSQKGSMIETAVEIMRGWFHPSAQLRMHSRFFFFAQPHLRRIVDSIRSQLHRPCLQGESGEGNSNAPILAIRL
jgi:hypothetical protein